MNMSEFMVVFDVAVGILGVYLLYSGIKNYKKGEVDPMIVAAEEMVRCTNIKGLSEYLMPKESIFGGFCILFFIQAILGDTGVIDFPGFVNGAFLFAFLVVWFIFSYYIRKGKSKFIQ